MAAEVAKVPVGSLADEPYATIICYPRPSRVELRKRLKELEELGVSAIEFSGEKQVLNLHVLGKGCVGLVVKAYQVSGEAVALKIRRVDADRSRKRVKNVLREVLEQCWRLDEAGLDHGELSHAPKHIIVDMVDRPFIVDFETASLNRKPSNVTSITQFLFISGMVAEKVRQKIGEKDNNAIIEALRRYKAEGSRRSFEEILKACGI
jgi:putative serine/threonine protein kinase